MVYLSFKHISLKILLYKVTEKFVVEWIFLNSLSNRHNCLWELSLEGTEVARQGDVLEGRRSVIKRVVLTKRGVRVELCFFDNQKLTDLVENLLV